MCICLWEYDFFFFFFAELDLKHDLIFIGMISVRGTIF